MLRLLSFLAQCPITASTPTGRSGMALFIQTLRHVRSRCGVRRYMLYLKDRCNHSQRLRSNGLKIYSDNEKVSFISDTLPSWLHVEVPYKLGLYWTETLQCELSIDTRLSQIQQHKVLTGVSPINCLYKLAQEELYVRIGEHHQWLVYMRPSSITCTTRYCISNRTDI